MSDEIKKTVLNTLAEPIANSAKNITDKPTQNIGTTLADIWYLVFGGISQAAEKRKLKYSYALQEFEKELQDKISKIPEDKLVEPDIQVVAPALDSARYCIEKKVLRELFSNLISSSMNTDTSEQAHPIFADTIKHLSTNDANLLTELFKCNITHKVGYAKLKSQLSYSSINLSLSVLENLGLIYTDIKDEIFNYEIKRQSMLNNMLDLRKFHVQLSTNDNERIINIQFTELGLIFCNVCISN